MNETLTLQFDGGSRGNPGPAGIGVVVLAEDGTQLVTLGRFIGRATNNVAEYRALITALEEAKKLEARRIIIRGDSELIIKQMRGEYRVKNPDMKVLHTEAMGLYRQFESAKIEHNLRHKNELADKLANLAMDRKGEVTDVDDVQPPRSAPAAPLFAPPVSTASSQHNGEVAVGDTLFCARCKCELQVKAPPQSRPSFVQDFACQCGGKMQLN